MKEKRPKPKQKRGRAVEEERRKEERGKEERGKEERGGGHGQAKVMSPRWIRGCGVTGAKGRGDYAGLVLVWCLWTKYNPGQAMLCVCPFHMMTSEQTHQLER